MFSKNVFLQVLSTVSMMYSFNGRWTKNFRLLNPLVMITLIWTLYFSTPKYLCFMWKYTLLVERFCHKKAITCLLFHDSSSVCLISWLDHPFDPTWNPFCLPSSFALTFRAEVAAIYCLLSLQMRALSKRWEFLFVWRIRNNNFLLPKNHKPIREAIRCLKKLRGLVSNSGCLCRTEPQKTLFPKFWIVKIAKTN